MLASLGFNLNSALLIALVGVMGAILRAIINAKAPLQRITNDREANLLAERATEMDSMRKRLEALELQLEQERVRHDAERALDRHRLNNMDHCLNYLFMVFEKMPEKVPVAMAAVKEMRARQMETEALEKAAIHAAAIKRAGDVG